MTQELEVIALNERYYVVKKGTEKITLNIKKDKDYYASLHESDTDFDCNVFESDTNFLVFSDSSEAAKFKINYNILSKSKS
jgi:hypothetical protein